MLQDEASCSRVGGFFSAAVLSFSLLCTVHVHVSKIPVLTLTNWNMGACVSKCDGMKPTASSSVYCLVLFSLLSKMAEFFSNCLWVK